MENVIVCLDFLGIQIPFVTKFQTVAKEKYSIFKREGVNVQKVSQKMQMDFVSKCQHVPKINNSRFKLQDVNV